MGVPIEGAGSQSRGLPCEGPYAAAGLVTGGEGYVFTGRQGPAEHLSKTTVGVRLQKALEVAGVKDWRLYAAHSLRRGGATHAAKVGLPLRMIQAMGRWKSDAVRVYLYCSPEQLFAASTRLLSR